MLNESVATFNCDKTKQIHVNGSLRLPPHDCSSSDYKVAFHLILETTKLDIPSTQPWYEQWRETFLSVQFPTDHEFTRHFLSCLIVLSSSDPNPLDSANNLTKKVQMMQNVTPQKLPKWLSFGTEILNSYVMLHDGCQGDITKYLSKIFCFQLEIHHAKHYAHTFPGLSKHSKR